MNEVAQGVLHHSLVFSSADEKYKAKRAAVSTAFYKERLKNQMEVLKDLLAADIEIWKKRIAESNDKSTTIDMMTEFEQFFSKTVIMISFGEDVTNQKFKM